MRKFAQTLFVTVWMLIPIPAFAGPPQDANAVVDRWSAAYSSNDPEAVVKNYWSDAILLGTVSPVMSEGTEAIRTYFSALKGSGNKNAIGDRRTIVLDENAVVVAGFYEFTTDAGRQACASTISLHDAYRKAGRRMAYRSSPFVTARSAEDLNAHRAA